MVNKLINDIISYTGYVDIYLKKDEQVLKEYHSTNHAYNALFRFLCECLGGYYTEADSIKPAKIKLYYNKNSQVNQVREQFDKPVCNNELIESLTELTPGFITLNALPTVNYQDNEYSITYHFSIPFAHLAIATETKINQIILFATDNTPIAYYLFIDPNNKNNTGKLTIDNMDENTNIVINWTMVFANAKEIIVKSTTDSGSTINKDGGNK